MLTALGYDPLAVSGVVTSSPLALKEAEEACQIPVVTPEEISSGALAELFLKEAVNA
jgi:hypothetical protein